MNLRLIEHRQYRSKIKSECIVKILNNDGRYSRMQDCKDFGISIKYKSMNNIEMPINKHYIVVDHLFHPTYNSLTILVCMEKLDDNNYTLIANNSDRIKLIKGKIPEPHK